MDCTGLRSFTPERASREARLLESWFLLETIERNAPHRPFQCTGR
jgi:hypothetical protein